MMFRVLLVAIFFLFPLMGGALPSVTFVEIKEDSITLSLTKPLLATPKKATLEVADKSKLKFYFDIGAALAIPPKTGNTPSLSNIKVAQFDKQTVRVVALADKNSKFSLSETKNSISIKLDTITKKDMTTFADEIIKEIEPDTKPQPLPQSTILSKKKVVVIDPGHGGKDPGALGKGGVREKDIVLGVSQMLADMLKKEGYAVYMTRSEDIFVELQERTRFANKKNADVFVSIHANAIDPKHNDTSKFEGVETYFLSPARSERAKRAAEKENGVGLMDAFSKETFLNFLNREKIVASNKLAIDVQRGMLGYTRSKYKDTADGGVKEAPFWVLVGAQMPAVLVELGYMTHGEELKKLQEDYYKALLAKGIMEGIENYFQNN